MGYAKYLKDESVTPERRVYAHFTIYEEVGTAVLPLFRRA